MTIYSIGKVVKIVWIFGLVFSWTAIIIICIYPYTYLDTNSTQDSRARKSSINMAIFSTFLCTLGKYVNSIRILKIQSTIQIQPLTPHTEKEAVCSLLSANADIDVGADVHLVFSIKYKDSLYTFPVFLTHTHES
ncbi:unnamed protein product [Orchesella dallaii]|uniref:Uncharacterized protein n=1 Tax=Orchesella dallaii TaxID=48710 RepID=A0ABP1S998_9HEXA